MDINFSQKKEKGKNVKFNNRLLRNSVIYKIRYYDKYFTLIGDETLYENKEIKNIIQELNTIFEKIEIDVNF